MRALFRWTGVAGLSLVVGLTACSGGDDGPTDPDPDPTGSVRATVTGDGAALAGVTVRLYADGGSTALETGSTAASGQVTFDDLDVGAYDVDIVVPAGYELPAGGALRRDVTVEADEETTVTFALDEIVVAPTVGQIRARVTEEGTGVAGVEVNLYAAGGGSVLETLSTASDGGVLFTELDPGDFEVEIELPDGYEMSESDEARKEAAVEAGVTTELQFAVIGPEVVVIEASGSSFSPSNVTIEVGETVRWVRVSLDHTVTPVGHTEWNLANLNATTPTFQHTFDEAGEYDYRCDIHVGMTGTVTVE